LDRGGEYPLNVWGEGGEKRCEGLFLTEGDERDLLTTGEEGVRGIYCSKEKTKTERRGEKMIAGPIG